MMFIPFLTNLCLLSFHVRFFFSLRAHVLQNQQVTPTLGPDASTSGMPPNGAPGSVPQPKRAKPNVTAPPPGPRPSSKPGSVTASSSFGDMDLDNIPPGFKKEGTDWFALYVDRICV